LTAILLIHQRLKLKTLSGHGTELLDLGWVKRSMESRWFQPAFQIPVFFGFVIIIVAGLFDIQKGDMNIATLLMWTIWWAAIIFTFVFVGRIWCMMCPFGAAQDWIGRIFSLGRHFPKPLRNIYLPSLLFFGLTWWDSYSGIVNKPGLTAWLLIGFFGVAIATALVYRGRTFCRYICPIGGLIGLYSMFSPVELRNRCADTCRQHKTKECVKGTDKGSGCPMFETPMTLDRNNYCNFCGECVKTCSQNNVSVRFRTFAKDLWSPVRGFFDEAYLAMALVGISIVVTGEMVEPWHRWMDAIGKHIPFEAFGILDHVAIEKATFSIVLTIGSLLVPISLLFLAALVVRKATGPDSPLGLKETAVRFAYMFIPVGLSMHLAHNVSHLFQEGPGIIPAVKRAMNEHLNAGFAAPDWGVTPLMGQESIFWVQMLIFTILNVISLYAGYRISSRFYGEKTLKAFIPMALLALFFMALNTFILGQPMSLRHSH
jgi:ferredoxin